jgi:hypothetical protein
MTHLWDLGRSAGYLRSGLPFRQLDFRLPKLPSGLLRRVALIPHHASLHPAETLISQRGAFEGARAGHVN